MPVKHALALLIVTLTAAAAAIMLAGGTSEPKEAEAPEVSAERIISQLEPIEELSTLRVGVSGIVQVTQTGTRFWQGESRMVLIARGTAVYSVDLRSLEVTVRGREIWITLDSPRVTDSWVDVEQSIIWQRTAGRFMDRYSESLESACWSAAGEMVREVAGRAQHRAFAQRHAEQVIENVARVATPDAVKIAWR